MTDFRLTTGLLETPKHEWGWVNTDTSCGDGYYPDIALIHDLRRRGWTYAMIAKSTSIFG